MNAWEAHCLAIDAIAQHGLKEKGWRFKWNSARDRIGTCSFRTKTIYMSRAFVEINEIAAVKDVILHEIAHAICGPRVGHSALWRATAISIGCNGERCVSERTAILPRPRYSALCPKGCPISAGRNAKPRKQYNCVPCKRQGIISPIQWRVNP